MPDFFLEREGSVLMIYRSGDGFVRFKIVPFEKPPFVVAVAECHAAGMIAAIKEPTP